MDRKKQLQIKLIQNNIIQYQTVLDNLTKQKETLEIQIANDTHLDTNKITLIKNNLSSIRVQLDTKLNDIKRRIVERKQEFNKLTNELHMIPTQLNQTIENEKKIYQDECINIKLRKQELMDNHKIQLEQAHHNKHALLDNISQLHDNINIHSENVKDIQIQEHQNRKNILAQLHQKKQEKLLKATQIQQLEEYQNVFINQITDLATQIESLQRQKQIYINTYYNTHSTPDSTIPTDNLERNNIALLDNMKKLDEEIIVLKDKLNFLNMKSDKVKMKMNVRLNNVNFQQRVARHTNSFKTDFKEAKNVLTTLETSRDDIQKQIDNFNTDILGQIDNNTNNSLAELDNDFNRAEDRLNIMLERIQTNYSNLENSIKSSITNLENELVKLQNDQQITMQAIRDNMLEMDLVNNNIDQLDKLNLEIQKYQNVINQFNQDIQTLSNN